MDQETKDYLDRKLLTLSRKEDIEKLRQETKANFRQWKDENTTQVLEGIQEIRSGLEQWRKEEKQAIDSLRTEVTENIEALKEKKPFPLDQWTQDMSSSLQQTRGEIQSNLDQLKQDMGKNLHWLHEEETTQRSHAREEWKTEIDRLSQGQEDLREETKKVADQASSIHEKIKEGLTEIKDELGSMMRFSFADLEKKVTALEARIKALEKMVFH
jgi:uncharacterized phage infection (PIP) family protein YhgE